MKKLVLGINECSNVDYHSDNEFLSSSNLKLLLKDREQFYKEKILGERKDESKSHFEEGSLTHALILEPEIVNSEFAFYPGLRKQGADFEQFRSFNQSKMIISQPQKVRAESYKKAYLKNQAAVELCKGGMPEHTICQMLLDVPLKIRCDYINVDEGYIADVKTTSFPADVDSFKSTVKQWSYELSAALYCDIASEYYKKPFDFYFIVIDKKNLVCEVYKASQATLESGRKQIVEAIKIYKQCKKTGIWSNEVKKIEKVEISSNYEILEV